MPNTDADPAYQKVIQLQAQTLTDIAHNLNLTPEQTMYFAIHLARKVALDWRWQTTQTVLKRYQIEALLNMVSNPRLHRIYLHALEVAPAPTTVDT